MLLAIDVGNTNTVFAVFEGETLRGQWRAATEPRRTADEYAVWLDQLLQRDGLSLGSTAAAIISNVVPQSQFALRQLCERYCGVEPLVIGEPGVDLGIRVNVERPSEVGADRLVNAVAAHRRYPGTLIVIDFGTATTFDAVGADGAYEGGVIAPGINLSLEALHRAAAQLPRIAVEPTQSVIGRATVPAMQSGIYWGYVGLIEGIVSRMKAELPAPVTTVATGGLASLFAHATSAIERVAPDLTTLGLLDIYRLNAGKPK
ncbi:MAG: type III pantothenate kinase [Alphaproteobacteria bacterium]